MHSVVFPNSGLVCAHKQQQHISANQSPFHGKEIADGALSCASHKDLLQVSVSTIRADGNRKGRSRRNVPSDKNAKEVEKAKTSSQEEIIALFRRIQSSISKEGSSVTKKRTPSKPKDDQSAELILGALRRYPARKQAKDKIPVQEDTTASIQNEDKLKAVSPQDGNYKLETNADLPRYGDKPELEVKESISATEVLQVSRPSSNFVKKSPIPQPSSKDNIEGASEEQLNPVAAKQVLELQKIEEMKLPELKEVAKTKGIKGYSKLKKGELLKLLKELVQ
ncbi:hypothetical protein J5N97_026019 [Dioscorea zingiberensis]|uniref:Rho termination factor-like N-terminal domain-containing protein n=1 Tax=Dioscorea zingiberensis TaxID=325984 RepID=A0A9D5C1C0_9LILI|nr:hypothetical protein J5N97_026019 [Dioscorea zingiberensis]